LEEVGKARQQHTHLLMLLRPTLSAHRTGCSAQRGQRAGRRANRDQSTT